jgi:uncharacterized membrane protein YeaQ/YmgE (transglycosylase-associated protein family)
MFMNLVCWIAVGLIGGLIASRVVNQHGDDPKLGVMLGAAGAVVCGFAYAVMSAVGVNAFNPASMWAAVGGAVVALVGWNVIRGLASRA